MNWIDIVILIILAYYAVKGYTQGIISIIVELAGYVIAYVISLKFGFLGASIISKYASSYIPSSYVSTIGIALIWLLAILIYYIFAPFVVKLIPPFISHSIVNKVVGVIGSVIKALILVSLALLVLVLLPIPSSLRSDINNSKLASEILKITKEIENKFGNDISKEINTAISQVAIIPSQQNQSGTEPITYLGYKQYDTSDDTKDEQIMFNFVNTQRENDGLKPLTMNTKLQQVARNYGVYMFNNGFFGHITPSGQSPYDRVSNAGIQFQVIGENIAKAPDVDTADTGFMNSPEHKANILDKDYTQIGIGAIDGGIDGKIFVQDFIGI